MPAGRPTKYSLELANKICSRLAAGEPLTRICREPDMPCYATVMDWLLGKHPEFTDMYTRARELQAEYWAEEIQEIADDGTNDFVERETKNGKVVLADHEHINRSRLRVDARKWTAARLLPRKYGDKLQHTGDGGGAIEIVWRGDDD